jgi:5'-deoxynucleotidase YfbR-like HD superfamily hydrolase
MKEYIAQIANMAHIKRYSVIPVIHKESIAEHSFFVSAIVIKLHQDYIFDLGTALAMATIHDMTESYTDDITILTKRRFPKIAEAVEEAEYEIASEIFPSHIKSIWYEYKKGESVEAKIVKLADTIQVMQYAYNEMRMGNCGYMVSVHTNAEIRFKKLEEQLNELKR